MNLLFYRKTIVFVLTGLLISGFFIFLSTKNVEAQPNCTINSSATKIRPNGSQPKSSAWTPYDFPSADNPYKNPSTGFLDPGFDESNPPIVYVDVDTSGCDGYIIDVRFVDSSANDYSDVFNLSDDVFINMSVGINQAGASLSSDTDDFTLAFTAGENECLSVLGVNDCEVAIAFFAKDEPGDPFTIIGMEGSAEWYPPNSPAGNNFPVLAYDCDGSCLGNNWAFIEILPYQSDTQADIVLQANPNFGSETSSIEEFYSDFDDSYLAPILGNEVPNDLGGYLQNIFTVLIILAGVLSFIMVVVGAVTYMSADAISGKSSGRVMMTNAVFGLVLALGCWVVLNTINPFLASNLGFSIPHSGLDVPQKPVDGKYCNGLYDAGEPWPDDSTERANLESNGISINKKNCRFVGQPSCTSVYQLSQVAQNKLIALKNGCGSDCNVVVSGGTECWLHGGGTGNNTTHQVGGSTVDMHLNAKLDEFIKGQLQGVPLTWATFFNVGGPHGGEYYWEYIKKNDPSKGSNHWHVKFN